MSKNITSIINIQALKWENEKKAVQGKPQRRQNPVITISSEYGSQGQEIGKRAAELLGFDFYDRALIDRIASSANASRLVVESLDNRTQDWISDYIAGQFNSATFTSGDYLHHLSQVLLGLGYHGQVVIIGRGAQFILNPELTLRVRTMAPLDLRIRYVAQAENLSEKDARAKVLRITAERTAFCRLHFNRDVADPAHYDLIINTTTIPIELNAELIEQAFRTRFLRRE